MTATDEHKPPKIRVIWEELSCSPAHGDGGLETVVVGAKILYKEKERFGGNDNIPKTMVRAFIYSYFDAFRQTENLERHEPDRETRFSQTVTIDT